MFNFQCSLCQKQFSQEKIIYKWGKEERSFCQNCNEKNQNKCIWCEKTLPNDYYWDKGKFVRENNDGSSEQGYKNFCDEKCQNELWKYQENKPERIAERQKQELINQSYKPCQGAGPIPFLADLEKCKTLIPPTENYCDRCKKEQAKEKERQKEWDQKNPEKAKINQEKYQQAQNWWNSLSEEEKQAELKKIEVEWIKRMRGDNFESFIEGHGSLVKFKNGRLHCSPEDLSLVPVVFLERFGIKVYSFRNLFPGKEFPGYNEGSDAEIDKLERELAWARQKKDQELVCKLEQEIKNLKGKSKTNTGPLSKKTNPLKKPLIICAIGGGILTLLVLSIFLIVRKGKVKNPKTKL